MAHGRYDTEFKGGGYKEVDELAQTLTYAEHEISKVDTMQRDLIANVSHDLRTPLTMLKAYAEMIRELDQRFSVFPGDRVYSAPLGIIAGCHPVAQLLDAVRKGSAASPEHLVGGKARAPRIAIFPLDVVEALVLPLHNQHG